MIRGFVTGLIWGGVVAGAGLAVVSQVAPLPQAAVAPVVADSAPTPASVPDGPATAPADLPVETGQADAPSVEGALSKPGSPEPETAPQPDTLAEPPAAVSKSSPERLATPEAADLPSDLPRPEAGDLPAVAPLPAVPPLVPETAPAAVDAPPDGTLSDPLLGKTPQPAPQGRLSVLVPDSQPSEAAEPKRIVPDGQPLTDRKEPTSDTALPRIGEAPKVVEPQPVAATPIDLFSRPFDNPDAKPLFALVLVDDGAVDTDRETLASLPFPVTFVIDPMAPDAANIASVYRKAGQEVMMQTAGIPKGAKAADLEQSYQAMDIAMPEAVAVLGAAGLAEDSRDLAAAVVPILAAQGRGIVTMERGLNAIDQAARRAGLPQATVFRILDASGESVPVMRRYLDRAAFRAAQEGSVMVLGSTRPDTVAAILQWKVEGRAASVALAPVSAILRAPK